VIVAEQERRCRGFSVAASSKGLLGEAIGDEGVPKARHALANLRPKRTLWARRSVNCLGPRIWEARCGDQPVASGLETPGVV
jgi:hypothetical protein